MTKTNDGLAPDKVDLFPTFGVMFNMIKEFEHAHAQFPKLHKFTVGKRISTSLIVALEKITEAIVSDERRQAALVAAIVELEKTRILIRLAHDLRALRDKEQYARFSRLIVSALEQVTALWKAGQKPQGRSSASQPKGTTTTARGGRADT